MSFFGGLLNAIGGPIVSAIGGAINNNSNLKAQRQMLERQYEMQNEMWQKQNEYDKPVNQINRLVEANLNPNLAYGMGTPGNSSGFPTAPSPSTPGLQNPLQSFGNLNVGQATANIENVKADSNLKNAQAENLREQQGVIAETKTAMQIANYIAGNTKDIDIETKRLLQRQIQNSVFISDYEAGVANLKSQYGLLAFSELSASDSASDEKKAEIAEHNENARKLINRLELSTALEVLTGEFMYAQLQNSKDIANISADASKFGALVSAEASKYVANKSFEGVIANLKQKERLVDAQVVSLLASAYLAQMNGDWQDFYNTCQRYGVDPKDNSSVGQIKNIVRGALTGVYDGANYLSDKSKGNNPPSKLSKNMRRGDGSW